MLYPLCLPFCCLFMHVRAYVLLPQVDSLFSYGLDLHSKNLSTFNGAKQEAYGYVEGSVNQVKAYLDPTPYIQLIGDKAATYVNPDKILDTSFEVAGKVATFGPGAAVWWFDVVLCGDALANSITPAQCVPFALWCTGYCLW